jgi:Fe-S cluster biogenesis protein NfuA
MSLFEMFKKKSSEEEAPQEVSESFEGSEPAQEEAIPREVLEPKILLNEESKFDVDSSEILIKARPERDEKSCTFLLNKSILKGFSWVFKEEDEGCPEFIKEIFSLGKIKSITLYESNLIVEKTSFEEDWKSTSKEIGKIIRTALLNPVEIISESILKEIPSETELKEKLEEIIIEQINPALASHGGNLKIERVHGNTVYLRMGGGCQGCSSAEDTVKYGVENSFRENLSYLGAIFDETDHTSGENPYFS